MSNLRKLNPIAVAISDLHLTLLQPVCRADKDWISVQVHYLDQVKKIAGELPVICAGDIFDRWNASPELINLALEHLPTGMLCVPGQHDLPNHRIDLMYRSGYGVLVKAGKIVDISEDEWTIPMGADMVVYGYGWEQPITQPKNESMGIPHIAVIHRYVWTADKKYPGAPASSNVSAFKRDLNGYTLAITGDNHQGFIAQAGNCTVCNVGGFIRRKSDEIDYVPCVAIIYSDGSVKRQPLNTAIDRFHETPEERKQTPFDMAAFIEGLEGLGEHGLNFREAVENHLKKEEVHPATKEIILAALEAK